MLKAQKYLNLALLLVLFNVILAQAQTSQFSDPNNLVKFDAPSAWKSQPLEDRVRFLPTVKNGSVALTVRAKRRTGKVGGRAARRKISLSQIKSQESSLLNEKKGGNHGFRTWEVVSETKSGFVNHSVFMFMGRLEVHVFLQTKKADYPSYKAAIETVAGSLRAKE